MEGAQEELWVPSNEKGNQEKLEGPIAGEEVFGGWES